MALNLERIAENEQRIAKLDKTIQRSMAKKKKLMEENARLTYTSLCEQYNSSGLELLEILKREQKDKTVPEKSDAVVGSAGKSEDAESENNKDQLSFYN
ncbi:MAG: hypothetical protein J6B75_00465 [Ruminococcus sp.]|nr:hypothetical protein [Ruminococcus sp.]